MPCGTLERVLQFTPVETRQEIAGTPGAPRGEGWGDGQVGEVSEGRAALAPVAAPVGGCECRESCCSCTPVHCVDPRTPLTYTPYRRRQLRPELEIRPRSLEIFPSSHATDLPCLAGECGWGK